MTAPEPIVALVLAAGQSRRFGGDKLLFPLDGKPLGAHIADTIAVLSVGRRIAVVPEGSVRAEIFASRGFEVIANPAPERGMASSLALGAARAVELEAGVALVCLADMPYVTAEHLRALLEAAGTQKKVVTRVGDLRTPPAVFSREILPQLLSLTGDAGARGLLRDAHPVDASPEIVRDIDTPGDLG